MTTTQTTVKTTHTRLRDFYPTPEVRRETEGYRAWLVQQSRREEKREDRVAYSRAATLVPDGKRIFAPWNEQQSAYKILTLPQSFFLVVLFLIAISAGYFLRLEALTIALGLVTTLYLVQLAIHAFVVVRELAQEETSGIDQQVLDTLRSAPWPTYTILCPLYKEATVVPQFIKAMQALDYPTDRLQILLLTEEEDSTTRAAIHKEGILPAHFQVMTVPRGEPRTKPRACNYGLLHATGRYIVIFDAEDIPEPTQLKKAVLAFADGGPKLACVQAQLSFYNQTQNILTRLFSIEYLTWFTLTLPALARAGFALPLGGTSNHFQASVLRALGGWDAYNVTEDCDLGMRVHQYGFQTGMLASTTFEEATSQLGNWLRQRSRWIKGFMQTYLVHTRHPLRELTKKRGTTLLSLQAIIGGSFVVFINPLMWLLLIVYIAFRGQVEGVYQVLFPAPVLYGGALCLIAGNFFYVYIAMLICAKREQYSLVPWCFLLSLYWLLMSVAATKALFQLITKPHYWEKTRHGLHLGTGTQVDLVEVVRAATGHIADEETQLLPSMSGTPLPFSTTTERVRAIETLPVKAVSNTLVTTREKKRDYWFWATMVVASICSVVATIYVFQHHETTIYGDSISHLLIARRVFDNITPGIAQLGDVWLPLPHVLIMLFVWNDYLWSTGLAGSLVGMICYLIATLYIFLTARRITHSSYASFIGTLVFILNPNILFLQSTPMTEPVCWATFTTACYYMLAWVQEKKTRYLILAAASTFLATLARYDGWILVAAFPVLIIITGWMWHLPLRKIQGQLTLFCTLGSSGVILWMIWGQAIFGNPLYFQSGPYSSQQQTLSNALVSADALVKHHVIGSAEIYGIDTIETLGIGLFLLGAVAILLFLKRKWKSVETLGILAFLIPFVFYVAALFTGQVALFDNHPTLYLSGIIPSSESIHLFNARFGSEMVAPAAIFIATLVPLRFSHWKIVLGSTLLIIMIMAQSAWTFHGGVISIVSNTNPPFCVGNYPVNVYLDQHYNGGYILQTEYPFHLSESEAGIHFNQIIWEGSGKYWEQALQHPENSVNWIVLAQGDSISQAMEKDGKEFSQNFSLVAFSSYGLQLYHRNGLPPLPTRPVSSYLASEQQFCNPSNYHIPRRK